MTTQSTVKNGIIDPKTPFSLIDLQDSLQQLYAEEEGFFRIALSIPADRAVYSLTLAQVLNRPADSPMSEEETFELIEELKDYSSSDKAWRKALFYLENQKTEQGYQLLEVLLEESHHAAFILALEALNGRYKTPQDGIDLLRKTIDVYKQEQYGDFRNLHRTAHMMLGSIYLQGLFGVTPDFSVAFRHFHLGTDYVRNDIPPYMRLPLRLGLRAIARALQPAENWELDSFLGELRKGIEYETDPHTATTYCHMVAILVSYYWLNLYDGPPLTDTLHAVMYHVLTCPLLKGHPDADAVLFSYYAEQTRYFLTRMEGRIKITHIG